MLFSVPSPFFKHFYNHLTMTKWGRTSSFPSLHPWRERSGPSRKEKCDEESYPGQKSIWQKYLVSWDSSISVVVTIPIPALSQQIFCTEKKKNSIFKANNKMLVLKEFQLSWWADISCKNNSKSKVLHVAEERMTTTVPWGCMQRWEGRDRSTKTGQNRICESKEVFSRGRWGFLMSLRVLESGWGHRTYKKRLPWAMFAYNPSKCLQVK